MCPVFDVYLKAYPFPQLPFDIDKQGKINTCDVQDTEKALWGGRNVVLQIYNMYITTPRLILLRYGQLPIFLITFELKIWLN